MDSYGWGDVQRIDGENCSMNKIVHFIGFDGDGRLKSGPDFIHKFFDKRSLGDIDFDNDTVVFGRKTKLTPHPIWVDQDHNRH